MSEIITTYLLNDLEQPLPMDREDFYADQISRFHKGEKPNRAVEIVQIFLFTPKGEIILQKRSDTKDHNPGLIDKAVGGHVTFGNSPWYTATAETLQELRAPSFVVPSAEDFKKTIKLLRNFLNHSAIIQFVDSKTNNFIKIFKGERVPVANKYQFYIGVYDGEIKPVEKEVSKIIIKDMKSLVKDMASEPDAYTEDLKFFLSKYEVKISQFLKNIG